LLRACLSQIFWERTGRPARNIFDTQVAAGMLGHGTIGYGDLVKHYCRVTLQKGATVRAAQGLLSALSVFRRESILHGACTGEQGA
jgi:hypothetical protein